METKVGTQDQTLQQLSRENHELRRRCQFLEGDQNRSKQLTLEWQSFGKYTASVLKNEVETADKKIKYLEGRLEEVMKENKELKDMCLYLDQSQANDYKLTPPEITELLSQTKFLSKLNFHNKPVPQYSKSTSAPALKRTSSPAQSTSGSAQADMAEAVTELGKRLERLEKEKLELIKSLSAAHLLVANTQAPSMSGQYRVVTAPQVVRHPPRLEAVLQMEGQDGVDEGSNSASPENVANAVMLLDMVQRLEAVEANGFADPAEEAEVDTLKVLIAIAWQRIQEQVSAN